MTDCYIYVGGEPLISCMFVHKVMDGIQYSVFNQCDGIARCSMHLHRFFVFVYLSRKLKVPLFLFPSFFFSGPKTKQQSPPAPARRRPQSKSFVMCSVFLHDKSLWNPLSPFLNGSVIHYFITMTDELPPNADPMQNAPVPTEAPDAPQAQDVLMPSDQGTIQNDDGPPNTTLIGSAHIRPIFLGNLDINVTAEEISDMFTRPYSDMPPMSVERVDLKRGFAFVFMEDAKSEEEKQRVETYVDRISGMYVPPSPS